MLVLCSNFYGWISYPHEALISNEVSLPSAKVSLRAFLILNSSTWTLLCMVFQFGVKVIICYLFLICWTFCFCKEVKPTFQTVIIFPHLSRSGWHLLFTCMCSLSYWGGFVLVFFHWLTVNSISGWCRLIRTTNYQ